MVNVLYGELLKWKRSKMLWLIPIGALLPVLLDYFVALHKLERVPFITWSELFASDLQMMTMLMCPALFALFTGYTFAREYQERTINNFLTVPRSRIQLLLGKYAIMLLLMAVTLLLSYALTLVSGFALKHDALTLTVLRDAAVKSALMLVLQFALISITATVSILGKSYVPAMGLGVFAVISELTIMQSKYIMYYPWSAPLELLFHMSRREEQTAIGVTVMLAAFFVPLFFNMWYYRKADVHTG